MLDKIDQNNTKNSKSFFCDSPNQINVCNFCLTNSKEKEKERKNNILFHNRYNFDINSQKKNFEGKYHKKLMILLIIKIGFSTIFTPNKAGNQIYNSSTPGYLKFNNFCDNSDRKMNFAK